MITYNTNKRFQRIVQRMYDFCEGTKDPSVAALFDLELYAVLVKEYPIER